MTTIEKMCVAALVLAFASVAVGCGDAALAPQQQDLEIGEAADSQIPSERPSKPASRPITDEELDIIFWGGPLLPEPLQKWRPRPAGSHAKPSGAE